MSEPTEPERLGRYALRGLIGSGAFASVYRAHDPALDTDVALKVLAENWAADPEVRERFIREARVLRRLHSDRLVTVHDVAETPDGRPFVVLSLAERGTLETRLRTTPQPTVHDLWFAITELSACLQVIHAGSIVHRDIKPSNILIVDRPTNQPLPPLTMRVFQPDDALILADFGLARDLAVQASAATLGGTPGFMAPEQLVRYGSPDSRADIYGATAVLLNLLTRALAPTALSPQSVRAVLRGVASGVPPEFAEAIIRNLDPDPARRAPDALTWSDSLVRALHAGTYDRSTASNVPPATPDGVAPVAPHATPAGSSGRAPEPWAPPAPAAHAPLGPAPSGPYGPAPSGPAAPAGSLPSAPGSVTTPTSRSRTKVVLAISGAVVACVLVGVLAVVAARSIEPRASTTGTTADTSPALPRDLADGWSERPVPAGVTALWDVASAPARSVAVGPNAAIVVSDDEGRSWRRSAALENTGNLQAVATDGKTWVALGATSDEKALILRSSDAISWTPQRLEAGPSLEAIATDGTTWVAAGRKGVVLTSTDTEAWTIRPVPPEMARESILGATHAGGRWVVVGSNNLIATSEDTITWTVRSHDTSPPTSTPTERSLSGVAGSGSGFVAVGYGRQLLRSPDGITWTTAEAPTQCNDIEWTGKEYVISARDGVLRTSDGSDVARVFDSAGNNVEAVSVIDQAWVIVGSGRSKRAFAYVRSRS